jgi:hypothetical protein
MNENHELSKLLGQWQPKNPHSLPKFVNDTVREIRRLDNRPWWKVWADSCSERADDLTAEWLPSPRALVPVAAAAILLVSIVQWTKVESQEDQIAALRWQQNNSMPTEGASLTGVYANIMQE